MGLLRAHDVAQINNFLWALEKHIHRKNMFLMLHRLGMKPYG